MPHNNDPVTSVFDADAYLVAAKHLIEIDAHQSLAVPVFFLLCHAMELCLKAYYVASGGPSRNLEGHQIQHNLDGLCALAEGRGLVPPDRSKEIVGLLSPYHQKHHFRYRPHGASFPLPAVVLTAASALHNEVERFVARGGS